MLIRNKYCATISFLFALSSQLIECESSINNSTSALCFTIYLQAYEEHWKTELKLQDNINSIDYTSQHLAFEWFPSRLLHWLSKITENFISEAHRMKRMKLQKYNLHRHHFQSSELDIFQVFTAKTILWSRKGKRCSTSYFYVSYVKRIIEISQILLNNVFQFGIPFDMQHQELHEILQKYGIRNIWHGIIPNTLSEILHENKLTTHVLTAKLTSKCLTLLYDLWI